MCDDDMKHTLLYEICGNELCALCLYSGVLLVILPHGLDNDLQTSLLEEQWDY